MSKTEIKAAMSALQVNVPIRLAQRAPVFQPPERTTENKTLGAPQDSEGSPEPQPSQDSRPTQVFKPKGVSKRQVLILSEDGQELRLNKKEMVAKDLVNHLSLSVDGYGAMTNRMLEILIHADFDKAEHEIIQFVMRESIFWRQEWTDPMSGVEFEWMSGISSSSLWTHMKRLAQKGCSQETEPSQDSQVESDQDSRPPTTSENQTTFSLYKNNALKTDLKTSLSGAGSFGNALAEDGRQRVTRERKFFKSS